MNASVLQASRQEMHPQLHEEANQFIFLQKIKESVIESGQHIRTLGASAIEGAHRRSKTAAALGASILTLLSAPEAASGANNAEPGAGHGISPAVRIAPIGEGTNQAANSLLARRPSVRNRQAARCAYRALARKPRNIRGGYSWDASSRDPEGQDETRQATQYYMSFKLPNVGKPGLNCSRYGKRIVTARQESYRKGNIIDTSWRWWPGSDKKTVKTNNSKKANLKVRAPRNCWPSPYSRNADYDKRKGSKGRPMLEVKWVPKGGGERPTKTYRGKTKKLC